MLTPERENFIRFLCRFFPHDCILLAPEGANGELRLEFRLEKALEFFPDFLEPHHHRVFREELFCGDGQHSLHQIVKLYHRIYSGISALSGEQQNGGQGTGYSEKNRDESIRQIDSVIEDVIAAFGAQGRFKKQ